MISSAATPNPGSATTRIVFMGTPEFAVPSLKLLFEQSEASNWEIVAVCTQPDRRAGRGKKMIASPVKSYAIDQGLPVLQPTSFRKEPEMVEALRELAPDCFVVAAYGLLLPKEVLHIPAFGSINVHASLLPAYRGASPINAALLDGLSETGVSIMLMDVGMDTGPVIKQTTLAIEPDDTTETLSARLAEQGARVLVETLPEWLAGDLAAVMQDQLPGEVSHCQLIKKQDGEIDWTKSAQQIERMTRAYAPWPGAFTSWHGRMLKIHAATVIKGEAAPGVVVETREGPAIGTGEGLLLLSAVQPAGKRTMIIKDFLNGAQGFYGSQLG